MRAKNLYDWRTTPRYVVVVYPNPGMGPSYVMRGPEWADEFEPTALENALNLKGYDVYQKIEHVDFLRIHTPQPTPPSWAGTAQLTLPLET